MSVLQALALAAAGLAAGTASAMAGGASIITFPVLLAMGVPPLTANVTNTVGLSPIVIGTGLGALPELRGQRARLTALALPSLVGALAGAVLLLTTPTSVFEAIVPALIAISCLLMLLQPWLVRHTLRGRGERGRRWVAQASTLVVGMYTGYFGAASGVLFLALVGLVSVASLHELNAAKNLLVGDRERRRDRDVRARRARAVADGAGARGRERRGRRDRDAARAPGAGAAPAGGDRGRGPGGGGAVGGVGRSGPWSWLAPCATRLGRGVASANGCPRAVGFDESTSIIDVKSSNPPRDAPETSPSPHRERHDPHEDRRRRQHPPPRGGPRRAP